MQSLEGAAAMVIAFIVVVDVDVQIEVMLRSAATTIQPLYILYNAECHS